MVETPARLLISAAHKSSGKTTLTLGLCAALTRAGYRVQPFKKGPDYIDPLWLGEAAGRPCHNLDFYLQDHEEIRQAAARRAAGADLSLIEGNKGLFDGMDLEGGNSNAALARLLETPVVLVIDCRGMTRGIAPLLLGYRAFDPDLNWAGVIFNRVGGKRHEEKLRAATERYTDFEVLGAMHQDSRLEIVERHLGLMPSNENREARDKIRDIAEAVAERLDLERLLALARQAPPLPPTPAVPPRVAGGELRVGIPRDSAFGFYYPGDLEALERQGARLIFLDTLKDQHLPPLDGLFIGGGFPETQMEALEANAGLRAEIRQAVEAGLPVYAECGGLMYLGRSLAWGERRAAMVGALPLDTRMDPRPRGRGYVHLRETGEGLWSLRDPQGRPAEFAAHEFHYSQVENLAEGGRFAYQVLRGHGITGQHDGLIHKNVLACYAHLREVRANPWTGRFLDFIRRARDAPK